MRNIMIVRTGDEDDMFVSGKSIDQRVQLLFGNTFIDLPGRRSSYKDVIGGFLGETVRLYEMQGGVVLYQEYLTQSVRGYLGDITLLSFDEQNETYQKLKSKLEKIASKNPGKIGKKIENFGSFEEQSKELEEQLRRFIDAVKNGKLPFNPLEASKSPITSS